MIEPTIPVIVMKNRNQVYDISKKAVHDVRLFCWFRKKVIYTVLQGDITVLQGDIYVNCFAKKRGKQSLPLL